MAWHARVSKGNIDGLIITAWKEDDGDVWLLEVLGSGEINGEPKSRKSIAAARVRKAVGQALRFQHVFATNSLTWFATVSDECERLTDLVRCEPGSYGVTFDRRDEIVTRYEETSPSGSLAVEMDRKGNPRRFFVNGRLNESLQKYYREWVDYYDQWLIWHADGDKLESITTSTKWYARLKNMDDLPRDWSSLEEDDCELGAFISVASNKKPGKMRDVMKWTDFIYIPGHKLTDPDDTIIIVSPPKNYRGRKALIATLGGEVKLLTPEEYEALHIKADGETRQP